MKPVLVTLISGILALVGLVTVVTLVWAAIPSGSPVLYSAPDTVAIPTLILNNPLRLFQQASDPSAPPANHWHLYAKGGGLYYQNSGGTVAQLATATGAQVLVSVRANQALGAGSTIQHAGRLDVIEIVQISSTGGAITNTATPRILAGVQGQIILVQG